VSPLRKTVVFALRIGFAVVLGWASIDKLLHPYAFSQDILNYRVVGEGLAAVAAIWLPTLELFTALCLLTGLWLDGAVLVNAGLMWFFLILILQAFFRRLDIHCGCFTVKGESVIGPLKIAENAVFAAGSLVLFLMEAGLGKPARKK
jgi:hypothetical protein